MLTNAISKALQPIKDMALSRLENPSYSLQDPDAWGLNTPSSEAGEVVDHNTALTLDSVFQAVSLISGDAASARCNVYKQVTNKKTDHWTIDKSHPADYLVSVQANDETSSVDFRRRLHSHALLYGNGYALIERSPSGTPTALFNLLPDRTMAQRDENGDLFYVTEVSGPDGQRVVQMFLPQEILHLKGLTINNEAALDLVDKARDSIGLAMAAANFGSRFFAQGAMAGGTLEIPPHFTQEAHDNLVEGWSKRISSKNNWFKVAILRDGAKFHQMTVDAQKSQLHELREDQVLAVARFFNLPPFKLGMQSSVSYNSTEQAQLVYLTTTLSHWLLAERSEYDLKLRTNRQKTGRNKEFRHDTKPLLKLDQQTHNEILQMQRTNMVITANEWREAVDLPPSEDPLADQLVNPNVMTGETEQDDEQEESVVPEETEQEEQEESPDEKGTKRDKLIKAHRELLIHTAGVSARRISNDVDRLSKNAQKFLDWIDGDMVNNRKLFKLSFTPVIDSIAAAHDIDYADTMLISFEENFFDLIINKLQPLTEPPHSSKALHTNSIAAADSFQNGVAAVMVSLLDNHLQEDKDNA